MKNALTLFFVFILSMNAFCQELSKDFKTIKVNKKISEFPDKFDLSSPLNSCITYNYIRINGKDRLLCSVNSILYKADLPDTNAPDSKISAADRDIYLNTIIKEVIIYKDSIACVIGEYKPSRFSVRSFRYEFGKWVSFGESIRNNIEESRQHFAEYAVLYLHQLQRVIATSPLPTDMASFVNYLKTKGTNPKEFVLSKLKKTKLVMYGEIHHRKISWDFLNNVLNDTHFASTTGVVFLELPSHKQKDMDQFMSNVKIDQELLLDVFREFLIDGWDDYGKFDFIVNVWKRNKNLSADKKIRIVLVDTPRPYSTFLTAEDMKKCDDQYDRDEFMAGSILKYMASKKDKRNALFIVGAAHLLKTEKSAGSIITQKMPKDTYTIFQHSPQVDNNQKTQLRIRHGMFDYAFYKTGDQAVAFELKYSPFGKEPFDGLYLEGSGTFQDNYDGYIFFGSLDKEPSDIPLFDLYSNKFIFEMDRRYHLTGTSLKDEWRLKELSQGAVIEMVKSEQTKIRWEKYIKPLKDERVIQ